jgi:sulfite reductase alpha subunit-like flavoprotein
VGESTFYFGCRHEKKDYLYGELWQELVAKGHLCNLHTAFSRDQVRTSEDDRPSLPLICLGCPQEDKVYVQHKLLENAKHTWDALVHRQAHFYVSGYVQSRSS